MMQEYSLLNRFSSAPVGWQNGICFAAMVVCLVTVGDMIFLIRQKHRGKSGWITYAMTGICFLTGYVIMHVCMVYTNDRGASSKHTGYELSFENRDETILAMTGNLKLLSVVLALTASMAGSILLLLYIYRWRQSHIVENSIKESMDYLPAGVCYYRENGLILLVNHRMNDFYAGMTGENLQNGNELEKVIREKQEGRFSGKIICRVPEQMVLSFRHRTVSYDGENIHEIIADDVTELYEKSEELKSDIEKARLLSESMKAYGKNIDEVVRRQEILQAKIKIHDEMNRMILSTVKVMDERGDNDQGEKNEIIGMWKNQMQLLKREGEQKLSNVVSDLNVLAKHIGIALKWNGMPTTENRECVTLFLLVAREALMNAVKHAGAGTVWIFVENREKEFRFIFENDGLKPERSISEGGGLQNIRSKVEEAGGCMTVEWKPQYRLTVEIPSLVRPPSGI